MLSDAPYIRINDKTLLKKILTKNGLVECLHHDTEIIIISDRGISHHLERGNDPSLPTSLPGSSSKGRTTEIYLVSIYWKIPPPPLGGDIG